MYWAAHTDELWEGIQPPLYMHVFLGLWSLSLLLIIIFFAHFFQPSLEVSHLDSLLQQLFGENLNSISFQGLDRLQPFLEDLHLEFNSWQLSLPPLSATARHCAFPLADTGVVAPEYVGNPRQEDGQTGVDPWIVPSGTPDPPTDDANEAHNGIFSRHEERSPAVSLTRVPTSIHESSTEHVVSDCILLML